MASKTITIRKEVYDLLLSVKGKDESFSKLFERLVRTSSNLEVLQEMRGSYEFTDKKGLLRDIEKKRAERRI
jgi:predicted CopG family antitoxin